MLHNDSKKCILSICDISPTKFGSFEEFIISLTAKLKENNFEHIVIFRDKPIKSVEDSLLNLGAKIEIIKPSNNNICNVITFYKVIKKNRPEIVHFHFYPVYTIVNYLKLFTNIRIVYTDHMGGKKTKTFTKRSLRKIYYLTNSKLFGIGIDKIICVSNFVKSKYSREYGINSKKLVTIYNGINTDRFQRKYETKKIKEKFNITTEFVVTCVGLRKEKGAHYLIEAAPAIIRKYPNVRFFLVGEGEYKNYLEERINELNIKNYFKFTGNTDSIEDIYSISSCVVIPTLVEESFCFVAAEAMSVGTPIVAFDSGAIKEIIYNKESVIIKNSKLLSEKIIECFKSDDLNIKGARDHVIKNLSLDKNVCNHVKLYKDLLK
ncbi:MAG: glycosyltransferase family 4 protein [Methanosarcina sp.]|uniref:glycosyltransferase family 4 protein n=1 Tax=Methanosarcina sp. TaxID=2213 RepID=UPI00263011B1|nr:glycosyltransferase family 4 protein [Methanosarcina sp.]MDD3245964.1 glycosyltransferase family 4 protein [Methanosarcina sp.]MDD4247606.1 glycosyltransferase family 4 protein [Methanosarcina sp.]